MISRTFGQFILSSIILCLIVCGTKDGPGWLLFLRHFPEEKINGCKTSAATFTSEESLLFGSKVTVDE